MNFEQRRDKAVKAATQKAEEIRAQGNLPDCIEAAGEHLHEAVRLILQELGMPDDIAENVASWWHNPISCDFWELVVVYLRASGRLVHLEIAKPTDPPTVPDKPCKMLTPDQVRRFEAAFANVVAIFLEGTPYEGGDRAQRVTSLGFSGTWPGLKGRSSKCLIVWSLMQLALQIWISTACTWASALARPRWLRETNQFRTYIFR